MPKKIKAKKPSDPMRLYRAVQEYITTRGGSVAVVGGVGIEHTAADRFRFSLKVALTGTKPDFATKP